MRGGFTAHGSRFTVGRLGRVPIACTLLFLAGCHADARGVWMDFERMIEQPRYEPYGESGAFADRRAMRVPPEGTVAHDATIDRPVVTTGMENGAPVARIPIAVTPALLNTGRQRFGIYCAPCHGLLGDGESVVGRKMTIRRPPPFHTPHMREHPDGWFFVVATEGYGLMPSYAAELTPTERWGVVAYIRALQLSQNAMVDSLPPRVRAELSRATRAGGGGG